MTRAAKAASPTTDMAASTTTETTTAPPKRRGRPPGQGKGKTPQRTTCIKGSPEAKKKAYLIIEALSGLRSPSDASAVIGVTVNRYYQIEWRALQGIVDALEVRPVGKQPSPEVLTKKLERERDRLERELRRAQALVRVAQRAVGLAPPQATRDPPPAGDGKKRRRRGGPRNRTARTLARFRTVPPEIPATTPSATTATTS